MSNAIQNILSKLASFHDKEGGEDVEDDYIDRDLWKPSVDDEPGCVVGTILEKLPHCIESFW